jgi:hypothetical protein
MENSGIIIRRYPFHRALITYKAQGKQGNQAMSVHTEAQKVINSIFFITI